METNERSHNSELLVERRKDDRRINTLITDVAILKDQMLGVIIVVEKVRELLAALKGLYTIAKWATAICTAIAAIIAGFKR